MRRILLILMALVVFAGCEMTLRDSWELSAMEIGGQIQGSFFLASGVIDETEYLFYWRRSGTGYVRRKQRASRSIVYETDGQPRVEYWRSFSDYQCRFYVPTGTMVPSFNLMRFD